LILESKLVLTKSYVSGAGASVEERRGNSIGVGSPFADSMMSGINCGVSRGRIKKEKGNERICNENKTVITEMAEHKRICDGKKKGRQRGLIEQGKSERRQAEFSTHYGKKILNPYPFHFQPQKVFTVKPLRFLRQFHLSFNHSKDPSL
jgi:hypothetical protein